MTEKPPKTWFICNWIVVAETYVSFSIELRLDEAFREMPLAAIFDILIVYMAGGEDQLTPSIIFLYIY